MTELTQLKSREVLLISGYIKGIDRKPQSTRVKAPYGRLAVVINTSYPEFAGGYFFDHDLVLKICTVLIGGRRTKVIGWPREARTFDELTTAWRAGWEKDDHDDPSNNDLFEEILVLDGKEVVMQIRGIDYHQVGGPVPYHDSATLEIFAPTVQADALLKMIQHTAAGAKVQFLEGVAEPSLGGSEPWEHDKKHPYYLRTWWRGHLPWFLINLGIADKGEDCEKLQAKHVWYNQDGKMSACYHCNVVREGQLWKEVV